MENKKSKSESNGVAVLEQPTEQGLQTSNSIGMNVVDLSTDAFPDMDVAAVAPMDLMADYWTPQDKGEKKRVLFDRIGTRTVLDQQTQEQVELECAFFYEKVNGQIKSVSNGSKRLVGALQSNNIVRGTMLEIEYLGKKTNVTNSFKSDNWSIKPLIIPIK